jgi:hypothetical protein
VLIDSLAKLDHRSRNAISAALIVLVAIAIYNWTLAPHVAQLHAVQQYKSVIGDLTKRNKILSSSVKLKRKKLGKLLEQFGQLQGTLFTVGQAKEFFSDLQVICEQLDCVVYSLNFVADQRQSVAERAEDTLGIAAESAVLGLIGTYSNIVKLVERLQTRPQKVWIDSFRMTTLDDGSGRLKCDITITIWTIPEKEAVPDE